MAAPSPPQYSAEFNQDAASADTSDSSRPQTGSSTTGSVATSGSSLESPYVTPFRTHPSSAERIDRRASSHIRRRDTAFAAASSRPVSRHASMLNSIPAQDADVPPSSTPPAPAPVPVVNTPQPSKVLLPVVDLDDIKTSYIPSAAWGDNFLKELDDRLYETKTTKKPVTFSMMLRGEDDSREVDSGASLFVSDVEAKDVSAEVLPLPTVSIVQEKPTVPVVPMILSASLQANTTKQVNEDAQPSEPQVPQIVVEVPPSIPTLMVTDISEADMDIPSIPIFIVTDADEAPPSKPQIIETSPKKPMFIAPTAVLAEPIEKEKSEMEDLLRRALEPCGIWLLLEKENDLELELKEKKKNYQRTLSDIQFVRDEMQLFRNHLLQVQKGITEILVENINLVQFIASSGTSAPKDVSDATRGTASLCKDYATSVAASCSSSSASGSSHSSRRNSSAAQKSMIAAQISNMSSLLVNSLSFTSRPMGSTVSIIEAPKIVGDGASGRKTRDKNRKGRRSSHHRTGNEGMLLAPDVQMARRSSFRDGAIAGSPSGSAEPLGQRRESKMGGFQGLFTVVEAAPGLGAKAPMLGLNLSPLAKAVSRGSFLTLNLESAPHEATGRRRSNTGLQGSKLSLALPGL